MISCFSNYKHCTYILRYYSDFNNRKRETLEILFSKASYSHIFRTLYFCSKKLFEINYKKIYQYTFHYFDFFIGTNYTYKPIIAASLPSRFFSIAFIFAVISLTNASSLIPDKLIRTFRNAAFTAARALIAAMMPSVIRF